jgi:predicted aldo/keto reductase-like oxidoreductase
MKDTQRRDFLKKSILSVSGAVLIPGSLKASFNESVAKSAVPQLQSRILGKTGIKTPLISIGTSGATNPNFVRAAYNAGVKLFFSATYYGEGNNEILVGEALKGLLRDSFVIGTAATPEGFNTREGIFPKGMVSDDYIKKAEESLKRFGLDYVDILLFPYASKRATVLFEPMLEAMQKLKKQGKTRFVGIATHNYCDEALKAAADSKVYDVAMTAYNYKTENKEALNEAIAYAVKAGLGIVAMKTIAGVYMDKERTKPINTNAALKWVLQNENISSIVSAMSSVEEMQKNLSMINDLKISEQELKDLNLTGLKSVPSLYCHQCEQCMSQCPQNLDIPTIMRSYMYAYGYRNLEHAQYTLNQAQLAGNPCDKCEVCNVNCTAGFDVKDRIQDIARLKNVPSEFLIA